MSTTIGKLPAETRGIQAVRLLWQAPMAVILFVLGMVIGGGLSSALGLKMPVIPGADASASAGASLLTATIVTVTGLIPLAIRLRGRFWQRWGALAVFCYVCVAINNLIEAHFFTTIGGWKFTAVLFAPASALLGLALAWCGKAPADEGQPGITGQTGAGRLALALLAFPATYWTFGMLAMFVAPWAREMYENGLFGLRIPSPGLLLGVALFRGSLYLLAAWPLMAMWRGSRRGLAWRLGLAFWVTVGLFGLTQGGFMPASLRILHSVEIGFDSFVYAALLVMLLKPGRDRAPKPVATEGV